MGSDPRRGRDGAEARPEDRHDVEGAQLAEDPARGRGEGAAPLSVGGPRGRFTSSESPSSEGGGSTAALSLAAVVVVEMVVEMVLEMVVG